MACERCVAAGVDHDKARDAFKKSLYATEVGLCGWERMVGSVIHRSVCNWIQRAFESDEKNILLMMARDFLKTSTLAGIVIWQWINNPELRFLLVHASGKMSAKLIPVLQRIVEGEAFSHFFPDLVPNKKDVTWNADEMTICRQGNFKEASIEARGITSTVTGGHYDILLFDDVVDENIARSPVEILRVIDFYENSPSLFDNDKTERLLVAGTFWEGGFYEKLIGSGLFSQCVFGAESDERFREFMVRTGNPELAGLPDGSPVWPDHFPKDRLERLKRKMGPVKYARQMLNRPITDAEVRFKREDFRYYNWGGDQDAAIVEARKDAFGMETESAFVCKFKDLQIYMTVDPATGENLKTDESAIVVAGYHPLTGRVFVLESWASRVLPDVLIDKIIALGDKWKQHGLLKIGIEEVGFQVTLKRFLQNEMSRRGKYFSIKPIKLGNRGKAERAIDGLQPFVANHQVYFLRNQSELLRELAGLQIVQGRVVGKSPNLVDALGFHREFWRIHLDRDSEEIPEGDEAAPRAVFSGGYSTSCET